MADRLRVAVLFGGRSTEHAISCISAGSVLAALDPARYEVLPVGITRHGRWVLGPGDPAELAARGPTLPEVADDGPALVLPATPGDGLLLLEPGAVPKELGLVDVVFPLLHGPYGEDGTVQGLLETAGLPYVGSGVLGSAACMDKAVMKLLLAAAGLPVGRYVVARPGPLDEAAVRGLGLPLFVKPARGGSSLGITKVAGYDDLPAALARAREHDPRVLVEAAVPGREVECGVLAGVGGAPPAASLPAEIRVTGGQEFYDFEAKYLDAATEFDLPADLPPAVTCAVRETALRAFAAMGCEGLARVDFFVAGDGSLTVNEVNTMPGFTPTSMFPRMWAATGLPYADLLDRLLTAALERGTGLH